MTLIVARQLAALGLVGLDVLVRGLRLQLLLPRARPMTLWGAITVNAYGEAAAAVTPGRLGGDPARFLGLRRAGVDVPDALAALGIDRLINWVLLGAAAVLVAAAFAGSGAQAVARLFALAATPQARLLVAAALVLAVVGVALARHYRHRFPARLALPVADAWHRARDLGWPVVAAATALTAVSISARVAILLVLVAGHPGVSLSLVVLASFALLYGQLLLPTPAGAGGVELGFVAGFASVMSAGELAALLVAWRIYTLILGATLGGVLFARGGLGHLWMSRRYGSTSDVNVRSPP
jgi:uncharacterized membrane protein YbhN (UPF0104 family)